MKTIIAKKIVQGLFLLTLYISLEACSRKSHDSKETAEEHNDAKFDKADEKDAQFLVDVAEINLQEIQLGQLAQEKGSIPEVRELGKLMESEHARAQSALKKLAGKKTISIPTILTGNGQESFRTLLDKTDRKFDKDYCGMIVNDYKKAIEKFEANATTAKDDEIRYWATSMLPGLRKHLDYAMTCLAICEKLNN